MVDKWKVAFASVLHAMGLRSTRRPEHFENNNVNGGLCKGHLDANGLHIAELEIFYTVPKTWHIT